MSHDVRVITTVAADPALAFRIFTEETDLWWGALLLSAREVALQRSGR